MKKNLLSMALCLMLAFVPIVAVLNEAVVNAYAAPTPTNTPVPTPTPDPSLSDAQQKVEQARYMLEHAGDGTFDEAGQAIAGGVSSFYGWLRIIGVMLLGASALVSVFCFAIMKNEQSIQKNKTQIGRILIGAVGVGVLLNLISIAAGLGDRF